VRQKLLVSLGSLLLCFGCAKSEVRTSAGKLTQAQIDEIVTNCGAPKTMVTLDGGALTIAMGKDLAVFGCVFDALYATGETNLKKVGNQRYDTPKGP
jgi:hypothetical protein